MDDVEQKHDVQVKIKSASGSRKQQHQDQAGKMDREVLELRLPRDQLLLRGNEKVSPKIASLQERISQFSGQDRGKELGLSLVKDKFGYPLPSPDREPAPSSVLRGGVQAKKELFMRPVSSPDQVMTAVTARMTAS